MSSSSKILACINKHLLEPQGLQLPSARAKVLAKELDKVAKKYKLPSIDDLIEPLTTGRINSPINQDILDAALDTESSFFTPYRTFKFLRAQVLPRLIKHQARHKTLRIVSAGCAAGQELFSIALLIDMALPELDTWDLQYFGFDISERQIERAQLGIYGQHELKGDTPKKTLEKYFQQEGAVWKVIPEIKKRVEFAQGNISTSPDLIANADLLFCRGILNQLTEPRREKTIRQIAESLKSHSAVILGADENFGESEPPLEELVAKSRCYIGKSAARDESKSTEELQEEEEAILRSILKSSKLFGDLPGKLINKIASRFELHHVEPGSTLMTQGQTNEVFFIIYEGSVPVSIQRSIFQKDMVVARLGPGDCCGEMSLLLDKPCTASVVTDESVKVFAASSALFEFLRKNHQGFNDYMVSLLHERREANEQGEQDPGALKKQKAVAKELEEFRVSGAFVNQLTKRQGTQLRVKDPEFSKLCSILRKTEIFKNLETGKIEGIADLVQLWRFPDAATIIKYKDEGLGLFFVDEGSVVVTKGSGLFRKGEEVATLKHGAILGELSILSFSLSNADVTAKGPVTVFVMSRELFRNIAEGNRDFYAAINAIAQSRR